VSHLYLARILEKDRRTFGSFFVVCIERLRKDPPYIHPHQTAGIMNGAGRITSSAAKTLSKSGGATPSVLQSPKRVPKVPASPASSSSKGATTTTVPVRTAVTSASGAYFIEPRKVPMGVPGVGATIATGLLIGAGISKNIASFLEENELFVPADDDDDD